MLQKYLYILFHIKKCAGATIAVNVENNLPAEEILRFDHGEEFPNHKAKEIERYVFSYHQEKLNKLRVIYGHNLFWGVHKFFK